jgi:flagellar M-ring protein FliF
MHIFRQLVLMAGIAASIALGVAVVLWSQTPEYRLLYSGLAPQDSARVSGALDQAGLDYRIDPRTGDITVPAAEVHSTRLVLARSGLPGKADKGFSILDQKPALGTSNFIERARFNRALQEELVQTIEAMDSVREARVHLSIPRQTSFLRSRLQPSASVMLNLFPGTGLSQVQVAGIKHLVSASVAGLNAKHVSVLDQTGSLLSMDDDSQYAMSSANLRLKRELEQDYAARIVQILTPIVGADRVHAQVSAELDFTSVETTQEDYTPENILRSELADIEETNEETQPEGIPGLLPTDPNAEQGGNPAADPEVRTVRSKQRTTRNYEVDRSISHIKRTPGGISRISVAVLIDYPEAVIPAGTAEGAEGEQQADGQAEEQGAGADVAAATGELDPRQYERIVELVRQTIGYDEGRGDVVSVIESDFFNPGAEEQFAIEESLLENPLLWSGLKNGAAALVVLFLIFGVLRPVLKSSVANDSALPVRQLRLAGAGGAENGKGAAEDDDRVTLSAPAQQGLPGATAMPSYDQHLQQARSIVDTEPERAARLIQGWVADDNG